MPRALNEVLTPERRLALQSLGETYGVRRIRVFGSYARGQAEADSDLDLLVDIDYGRGVAKRLVRFYQEAGRLLGMSVDVVTADGLDTSIHKRILDEARPI